MSKCFDCKWDIVEPNTPGSKQCGCTSWLSPEAVKELARREEEFKKSMKKTFEVHKDTFKKLSE